MCFVEFELSVRVASGTDFFLLSRNSHVDSVRPFFCNVYCAQF